VVKRVFAIYNASGSGAMSFQELNGLLAALDVNPERDAHLLSQVSSRT